jgi:N utilization substance protein A
MEVPEIQDGIIKILGAAREPGERAKIAVFSTSKDIDPVGACVGLKGSRVQSVVRELRGEKVDIVEWSHDIQTYLRNALSPAEVESLEIDEKAKGIVVLVPDDQLSLAIGKKGQNVRLASTLLKWGIEVKNREMMRKDSGAEAAADLKAGLTALLGINSRQAESLVEAGLTDPAAIAESPIEALTALKGFGEKTALGLIEASRKAAEGGQDLNDDRQQEKR